MELGHRLRQFRKRLGLTLQAVADRTGLSKSFVSQVESGAGNPSLASLEEIGDPLAALVLRPSVLRESPTAPPRPTSASCAAPAARR